MKIKTGILCSMSIMMLSFLFVANPLFAQKRTNDITLQAVSALEQARVYHEKGAYQQAIQEYGKFMTLVPGKADTYYRRGLSYHYLGDPNRAMQDYNKAVEIDPNQKTIEHF